MEESTTQETNEHLGRKIERVRRLRGMNQTDLGKLLGITKQAVSKIELMEKISDERLKKIADALGVTLDGLKRFNEDSVIYNTYNFYENCGVNSSSIGAHEIENINNFPIDKAIEFFEKLLEAQQNKFDKEEAAKK